MVRKGRDTKNSSADWVAAKTVGLWSEVSD